MIPDNAAYLALLWLYAELTATAILGAIWLLGRYTLARAAELRHALWTAGLVVQCGVIFAMFAPSPFQFELPGSVMQSVESAVVVTASPTIDPMMTKKPSPRRAVAQTSTTDATPFLILPLAWMTGLGFVLALNLRSRVWVHRVVARAGPLTGVALPPTCAEVLSALRRSVRVLVSDEIVSPLAVGTIRPTVVLPADCHTWSHAKLQATLLHELAHVRRFDASARNVALLASALHWYNPMTWIATRALQLDAEKACDAAVVRQGVKASSYVETLRTMVLAPRRPHLAACEAFIFRSEFFQRAETLLSKNDQACNPRRIWKLTLVASVLASGVAAAAVRPADLGWMSAQDRSLVSRVAEAHTESEREAILMPRLDDQAVSTRAILAVAGHLSTDVVLETALLAALEQGLLDTRLQLQWLDESTRLHADAARTHVLSKLLLRHDLADHLLDRVLEEVDRLRADAALIDTLLLVARTQAMNSVHQRRYRTIAKRISRQTSRQEALDALDPSN